MPTPTTPRLPRSTAAWLVWANDDSRLIRVERLGGRLMAVDVPVGIPDRQKVINAAIRAVADTESGR